MATIDILCLGVGKGASYVMKGIPSTAFAIFKDGEPFLLIDAGAGVALSYINKVGNQFPKSIYITHNHMDHTGDLPILLGAIFSAEEKTRVFGHEEVLDIVRTHRMHDPLARVDEVAEWITPNDDNWLELDEECSLYLHRTTHSYTCFGFTLFYQGENIFAYGADSPYDEELFRTITQAPIAIIDGREVATYDHPSFEQIEDFASSVPDCQIYIVHYETTAYEFTVPNISLMREGQLINLVAPKVVEHH